MLEGSKVGVQQDTCLKFRQFNFMNQGSYRRGTVFFEKNNIIPVQQGLQLSTYRITQKNRFIPEIDFDVHNFTGQAGLARPNIIRSLNQA